MSYLNTNETRLFGIEFANKCSFGENIKIGKNVTFGFGVVIEDNVVIGDDCFLGHYCIIRPGCVIDHHCEVRPYSWLAPGVRLDHHVTIYQYANITMDMHIESYSYIGVYTCFTNVENVSRYRDMPLIKKPPHVCRGARILSQCTILPGVRIGSNSVVGAGSLVTKDVAPGTLVYGRPAKFVRNVPLEEFIRKE